MCEWYIDCNGISRIITSSSKKSTKAWLISSGVCSAMVGELIHFLNTNRRVLKLRCIFFTDSHTSRTCRKLFATKIRLLGELPFSVQCSPRSYPYNLIFYTDLQFVIERPFGIFQLRNCRNINEMGGGWFLPNNIGRYKKQSKH